MRRVECGARSNSSVLKRARLSRPWAIHTAGVLPSRPSCWAAEAYAATICGSAASRWSLNAATTSATIGRTDREHRTHLGGVIALPDRGRPGGRGNDRGRRGATHPLCGRLVEIPEALHGGPQLPKEALGHDDRRRTRRPFARVGAQESVQSLAQRADQPDAWLRRASGEPPTATVARWRHRQGQPKKKPKARKSRPNAVQLPPRVLDGPGRL